MRILWIEDNKKQLKRKEDYFGSEICSSHEIKEISVFDEAYNAIKNDLEKYDFVVIDIDLTESDIGQYGEILKEKYNVSDGKTFLKTAGFDLNVQLILKGFPTERILFFSAYIDPEKDESLNYIKKIKIANAENNEEEFKKLIYELANYSKNEELDEDLEVAFNDKSQRGKIFSKWENKFPSDNRENNLNSKELLRLFQQAHIPAPNMISKRTGSNSTPGEEIQKWFKPRLDLSIEDQDNDNPLVTKQYLTLRRAILNVIDELQKNDDKIELNEDFKKGDFDKTAFLENIKWLLQAHEQPTLSEEFFLTLCDTFTKPFDIFSLWSNKNDIPSLISRNPFERSCLIPPFFLRNWIAHGLIPGSMTKFGARDAGFVFLMVMKSMFNREMYGKEDELKQLFENVSSNKKYLMDQAFKLQQTEYKFSLEGQILKQIEKKGTKDKNNKWMRENYLKHIYASNLFSSFKQVPESRMKDIRDIELDNKNNMRYIVTSAYELLDTPFLDITSLMLKENIK